MDLKIVFNTIKNLMVNMNNILFNILYSINLKYTNFSKDNFLFNNKLILLGTHISYLINILFYYLPESEDDVLRHNPEIAQMLSVALKYIPFLLILLSKAVFDHIPGKLNSYSVQLFV